jgi:hypothetical protein
VIRARIEALDKYDKMSSQGNSIALLKAIKALIYNFQSRKHPPLAIHDGTCWFYLLYQEKHMTCQAYLEKFQNSVDMLEHYGGTIGQAPGMMNMMLLEANSIDPNAATMDEIVDAKKVAQEQYLSVVFLLRSNSTIDMQN